MNNSSILIALAILAAALIFKLPIGSTLGRYQIVSGSGGAPTFRIDTVTGNAWVWALGPGAAFRWLPAGEP